jgi:hypothetical protein
MTEVTDELTRFKLFSRCGEQAFVAMIEERPSAVWAPVRSTSPDGKCRPTWVATDRESLDAIGPELDMPCGCLGGRQPCRSASQGCERAVW